jgi:hypothetical protein
VLKIIQKGDDGQMNKYNCDKVGDENVKAILVDFVDFLVKMQGVDLIRCPKDLGDEVEKIKNKRKVELKELMDYFFEYLKTNDLRFGQFISNLIALGIDFDKEFSTENLELLNIIKEIK